MGGRYSRVAACIAAGGVDHRRRSGSGGPVRGLRPRRSDAFEDGGSYTILVDRQTGYVQTIEGLKPGGLTQDAAVTQSFLVQYVLARETFDAADLRENYQKVMVWSGDNARSQYRREMDKTNPASPLVTNTATTIVKTTVKSVSLLSPTTALVRFDTTRLDPGASIGDVRSYAAVMSFHYTGAPMRMEDRFINPLGFQILSYRRDAETVTGASAPVAGRAP